MSNQFFGQGTELSILETDSQPYCGKNALFVTGKTKIPTDFCMVSARVVILFIFFAMS